MEMAYNRISRFIGRHEEREKIKQLLTSTDVRLLQIYGLPSVGKTELIRQVCQELSTEVEMQTIYRWITNGLWPNTEICRFLKDLRSSVALSVIVLDCFEKLSETEEFNKFYLENLWSFPALKIILVFQGLFPFKIEGFSDERIQVKPMNKDDARSLFYRRSKLVLDEDSDKQVDELVDFCAALPGQIIELTNKISQFPPDTILAEVYEFVKDDKTFCRSKDIFATLDRYIKTLSAEQCLAYSEMVYFPGTFTINDVTKMATPYKDDLNTKFRFLYPLLGLGLLKSTDEDNGQFQIPALFQDYANQQLAHLRHEDTTKLKFSAIIGRTLVEAERLWKMGLSYEALGIMKSKWTNVQKLLKQAIHSPSDGNSFQIYYKVAVDSSDIISLCYPNEARLFCKAIYDNAQIFGSEDQQALSMACYGHTIADSSQKEALQLYKKAEGILRRFNNPYQFIVLLYNMSKAYYQNGELQEGIRCAEEALDIQVTDRDVTEVQHVKTYAASYLAYNLIFATEYNKAEKILKETLQEVGESGHPTVPTLLNSLGLKEERSKGDLNKALTFYFSSLSKKRKVANCQAPLLVTTLCNVAGQLSKTKQKHDFALTFLYEAEGIRRMDGWIHPYSALVVWNIGMVYMRKQMQVEALMRIKEAEKLYGVVNRDHYVNAEVKIWLAHCHLLLDNAEEAKEKFLEIVRNGATYHKSRPQGEFVLNALEHLIHLSIQDPKEQQTYIEAVLKELPRLNKSPGVSPINSKKYREHLVEYMELLLKIAGNYAKSEPRPGIFLERIPDTCLACKEVCNYAMCPKDVYLQKLNFLTETCELFDPSDNNSTAAIVPCESETFQQIQSERPPTTSICSPSKGPKNNSCLLSSGSYDKSINSMTLPLPVKELCQSGARLESVGHDQKLPEKLPDFSALFSLEENDVDCNYAMCSKDVYLQKLNLYTSTCELFDQTGNNISAVVPSESGTFQQKQSATTSICSPSKEPKNNFGLLKSGFSDKSINSMTLPLPVKELCQSVAHSESVGHHQKVPPELPDFSALFSLEENDVNCENNRTQPAAQQQQNIFTETISQNDKMKNFFKDISTNLTTESVRQFQGNRNILENKQPWEFKSSTKVPQNITLTKPFKDNLDDTLNMNIGTNVSGYFGTTVNNAGTNCKLQTFLTSQRDIQELETKQKYILPSQQISKTEQQNRFKESNSNLPKYKLLNINSESMVPASNSFKNTYVCNPQNGQSLPNNPQRQLPIPVQMWQHSEPFWKNGRSSQDYFLTQTDSGKTQHKEKDLDHFKEKKTLSKSSEVHHISALQKSLCTTPAERNLLNAYFSQQIDQNRCCANTNSNNDSPRSQHNIPGLWFPTNNNLSTNHQASHLTPSFISRREPVEHDEH